MHHKQFRTIVVASLVLTGSMTAAAQEESLAPSPDPGFIVCAPPWPGDRGFVQPAPPWPGDPGFVAIAPVATPSSAGLLQGILPHCESLPNQ